MAKGEVVEGISTKKTITLEEAVERIKRIIDKGGGVKWVKR